MRLHDTLLGLLLMALAAAVFAYTFTFPAMPGQRFGPALFPQVVSAGISVCGLIIAARGRRSGQPWLALDPELRNARGLLSWVSVPLAVGLYLLLAPTLGFLPTAAVVVAGFAWWLGTRAGVALLLGVGAALAVQGFFGQVMRVPLPRGWFMQVLFGG